MSNSGMQKKQGNTIAIRLVSETDDKTEKIEPHDKIASSVPEAVVLASDSSDSSSSDEDDTNREALRARARARARKEGGVKDSVELDAVLSESVPQVSVRKRSESLKVAPSKKVVPEAAVLADSSSSDESSGSSSSSSSEEEEEGDEEDVNKKKKKGVVVPRGPLYSLGGSAMLRPVFRGRGSRQSEDERERLRRKEEEEKRLQLERKSARQMESRIEVAKVVAEEEKAKLLQDSGMAGVSTQDRPDDTDDDTMKEIAKWEEREFERLVTEKFAQLRLQAEREHVGPKAYNPKTSMRHKEAGAKKRHRGAFYVDQDSIRDPNDVRVRGYESKATEYEKIDKSKLHPLARDENFGKKGRIIRKSLREEDTTLQ